MVHRSQIPLAAFIFANSGQKPLRKAGVGCQNDATGLLLKNIEKFSDQRSSHDKAEWINPG
jgi:hypothetical protein